MLRVLLGLLLLTAGCSVRPPAQERDRVVRHDHVPALLRFTSVASAPEWTSLFARSQGWFGADGIFTIPMSGREAYASADEETETLMLFSDTVIGTVEDDSLPSGFTMVNNSVAYLQGSDPDLDKITFHYPTDEAGQPTAMFVPETPASRPDEWYWLGDGFVNENGTAYFFAYRMRDDGDGWMFNGVSLVALPPGSRPPFAEQRQLDTPLFLPADDEHGMGYFGSAVLVNTEAAGAPHPDGYIYVYGNVKNLRGVEGKHLIAARVRPEAFENFSAWRYWDGSGWSRDVQSVASLTDRISDEMSMTPLPDGRFALTFQLDTVSPTLAVRAASSPTGPFGPVQKVFECPQAMRRSAALYCYNAKAHPHLSDPGRLLVSYNVNSYEFMHDLEREPDLYRPRFVWLTLPDAL